MSKVQKRKVKLKVCRREDKRGKKRWVVRYARIKKDGKYDYAKKDWVIGPVSYQPKPFFYAFMATIYFWVGKIENDKCFKTMEPKIRVALSEGAPAFGCKFKENKFDGFTWLLKDKPYADFAIVNYERHKDRHYIGKKGLALLAQKLRDSRRLAVRNMEENSDAMFRIAIVVLKNGLWRFVPGKTLPEDKRHE